MSKLVPKRAPKVVATVAPAVFTEPEPTHVPLEATASQPAAPDADDEPTWFSTFMILYYGFFAITLLVYPSVHALDGPFPNPMAYWTTINDDLQFCFRMLAAAMIALLLGPFTDELFGGVGVRMKAFVEQMMIVNVIVWAIFLYYGHFGLTATMVPWVWKATSYFASFILAWNIAMLLPDDKLLSYYATFCAIFFGFFGVSLAAAPSIFFGPPSPTAYWTVWDEPSYMTGRALGLTILTFCAYGKLKLPTATFVKQIVALNIINVPLFILPAYYGGGSAVGFMWEIQLTVQIVLVCAGVYLLLSGAAGSFACTCAMPACGLNVGTFNLINVIWFVPFIAGFLYDPNLVFGPANPMGMSMFTASFTETALWFGKTWGCTICILVFGPYIFSVAPIDAAKTFTYLYVLYTCLFVYGLLSYDIFDVMLVGPTTGLNLLLAIFGAVAVSKEGGSML